MENIYKRRRFPPSIIQYAVWLYYRFNLSIRDVEDLLAQRNIHVIYESIRLWVNKFGPKFARRLKRRRQGFSDIYFLDEVFVKIGGLARGVCLSRANQLVRAIRLFTSSAAMSSG